MCGIMKKYIAADIGGTFIKYGLLYENGQIIYQGKIPTEVKGKGAAILPEKMAQIARLYEKDDPAGIAVATPGFIDVENGRIIYAGRNFPGYTGMDIRAAIENATGLPTTIENDAAAAALGESWLGAGKKAASMFCITVGTGVGGAAVIDGRLLRGTGGAAGEIGLMRLDEGTLEDISSSSALQRRIAAMKNIPVENVSLKDAFFMAKAGDADIIAAIDVMISGLSRAMAAVCCVLDPELIVLGGGIMSQSEYFAPRIDMALGQMLSPHIRGHVHVAFAELGNTAGMVGALRSFLQQRNI